MSYRVIVKGAPTRKLVDVACRSCRAIVEDVWQDDIPSCCGKRMTTEWHRAPGMDARAPFKVLSLGGPSFTSHHAMEKYAKQTGQYVISDKESHKLRQLSNEERVKRAQKGLKEATEKSMYRVRHGYKDFPNLPTEKELKKS